MKKTLLLLAIALITSLSAMAEEAFDGIIAYADGGETCYLLSEMPTVTYSEGNAILTVDGKQVATVELKDEQTLVITYGKYDPTGINTVDAEPSKVTRIDKIITGGRLIIIGKDGKQYDAAGKVIK